MIQSLLIFFILTFRLNGFLWIFFIFRIIPKRYRFNWSQIILRISVWNLWPSTMRLFYWFSILLQQHCSKDRQGSALRVNFELTAKQTSFGVRETNFSWEYLSRFFPSYLTYSTFTDIRVVNFCIEYNLWWRHWVIIG